MRRSKWGGLIWLGIHCDMGALIDQTPPRRRRRPSARPWGPRTMAATSAALAAPDQAASQQLAPLPAALARIFNRRECYADVAFVAADGARVLYAHQGRSDRQRGSRARAWSRTGPGLLVPRPVLLCRLDGGSVERPVPRAVPGVAATQRAPGVAPRPGVCGPGRRRRRARGALHRSEPPGAVHVHQRAAPCHPPGRARPALQSGQVRAERPSGRATVLALNAARPALAMALC